MIYMFLYSWLCLGCFLMQLLSKECYDIDIALDNMLGKEFCEKVNEYLLSVGEKPEGIGVIQWYAPFPPLLHLKISSSLLFSFLSIYSILVCESWISLEYTVKTFYKSIFYLFIWTSVDSVCLLNFRIF